jgi:hypothetical protein
MEFHPNKCQVIHIMNKMISALVHREFASTTHQFDNTPDGGMNTSKEKAEEELT